MLLLFTALAVLSFCGGALAVPSDRAVAKEEPTDRLLGGDPLEGFGKYPYYVTLHGTYNSWRCPRYRCPALLYDPYTLITTAQCILGAMGSHRESVFATCGRQARKIVHKIFHPGLNFSTGEDEPFAPNDIGMAYVHIPFNIDYDCQLVKLPDCTDSDFTSEEVDVIGYYTDDWHNFNKPSLVRLTVLSDAACFAYFGHAYHPGMHMCLIDPLREKAACFNDHGAPAIHDNKTAICLGSWIFSNCRYKRGPAVFSRLSYYLFWIEENSGEVLAQHGLL